MQRLRAIQLSLTPTWRQRRRPAEVGRHGRRWRRLHSGVPLQRKHARQETVQTVVVEGIAHPDKISAAEKWLDPGYATALGLLTFSSQPLWATGERKIGGRKVPTWLLKIISILEDLFGR